ncbi:MAG: AAA family ATPase [Pseudomonadota bacterium]
MNDPTNHPVDITEQRRWLMDHKVSTGASWSQLAKRINIATGTLSQFGSERGYPGNEQQLAEKVFRYRQTLAAQASIAVEMPDVPGYFTTETSKSLIRLLALGQLGRIVVAAMGAGLGKTTTARHYQACYSNVFLATMTPSTAGVNNMQIEVLEALGEPNAVGTPQKLSRRIRDRVEDLQNPLIILDEAQHLSEKAIDEARSWFDATGCGLALLGNIGVMQRIEGGNRKAAFAQLYSRIGMKITRPLALQADADALAAAWGVGGAAELAHIRKVCALPGGLRGATYMLELAVMIAASEQAPLAVDHLQDAWAQLSSQSVSA